MPNTKPALHSPGHWNSILDEFAKNPVTVIPDLIRDPEALEFTG